jgi:predicted negative regulator of RcsB-dependent stress response
MQHPTTSSTQNPPKSFWKQWGLLTVSGIVALGAAIGIRHWVDFTAEQPIAVEYSNFINILAEKSPSANKFRADYLKKFARSTIASKNFESVCGNMMRLARKDGVDPAKYSPVMADTCDRF